MNQRNTKQKNPLNEFGPGTEAYVRGKVSFCRIASHIAGEELEKNNQWLQNRRASAINNPYTRLLITDPQIVVGRAGAKTAFETHLEKRFFRRKKDKVLCFEAVNKNSTKLPEVGHRQLSPKTGETVKEMVLPADLAQGVDVMLKIRIFKTKNHANHGMSLDTVIIMEQDIRYEADVASSLAQRGMVWEPMPVGATARQPHTAAAMAV